MVQTTFGGTTTGFTYGPDGLRRTATSGGVTTQYVLDGQNVAQEVRPTGVVSYLWGPRGPECRVDATGDPLWFLYDGHGNVLGEVDGLGRVNFGLSPGDLEENPVPPPHETPLRDFDPWGYVNNWNSVAVTGNALKYCGALGHPSENTTGLIYMRARYYDPALGRFISEDPAKDDLNWYAYAGNDPVGRSDPDGLLSYGEQNAVAAIEGILGAGGGGGAAKILQGRVGQIAEAIGAKMAAMDAMFIRESSGRGGQLVWEYMNTSGQVTKFRWDFAAQHLNIEGFARNTFGGHDVPFRTFLEKFCSSL